MSELNKAIMVSFIPDYIYYVTLPRVPSGQGKPGKLGKGAVFRKSQGKPGKVRESLQKISQKSGYFFPENLYLWFLANLGIPFFKTNIEQLNFRYEIIVFNYSIAYFF